MTLKDIPPLAPKACNAIRQVMVETLAAQFVLKLQAIEYLPGRLWGDLTLRFRDGRLVLMELKQQHKIEPT